MVAVVNGGECGGLVMVVSEWRWWGANGGGGEWW